MPISPSGVTNLAALNVPNLYVQIVPPNLLLNGVPTDIIGCVGTATWGQLNAAVVTGTPQELISNFGTPAPRRYDLGTAVLSAMNQGASNFRCVRVSDGTDTAAIGDLIDSLVVPKVGANLTAFYTGSTGNTLNATIGAGSAVGSYKLSLYLQGGIPEVFDNILGVGNEFWTNLIDAVNLGQSVQRGPSNLVVASLPTSIGGFSITTPGVYTATPTVTVADGTGATFQAEMTVVSSTLSDGGTGYAISDTINLAGGTNTAPVVITVDTVDGLGAILTYTVTDNGLYTVLPTNPVVQDTTSGAGTGAEFNLSWGIDSIDVLTVGSGYLANSVVTISGSGGGVAVMYLGSISSPKLATTTLAGGTDGADVTSTQMIGNDLTLPRTGMYALRNNVAGGIFFLADESDPTKWTLQNQFAQEEGCYGIAAMDPGYQDNLSGAKALIVSSGIDSYSLSICMGDWCQINDTFNGLTRFISPQSFKAGILAATLPSSSSLNKPLTAIIATQKTLESRRYSTADLSEIRTSRAELITNPIPSGSFFGCRFGINTSSNPLTQTDNYPRMVNFIAQTILNGMGSFIGRAQDETTRTQARSVLFGFFQNLFQLGMIGDVNNPGDFSKACSIILDESNNPPNRVALGFMQADVGVVLFSIVQYFVINLNAQQGSLQSSVSILPAQIGGL